MGTANEGNMLLLEGAEGSKLSNADTDLLMCYLLTYKDSMRGQALGMRVIYD